MAWWHWLLLLCGVLGVVTIGGLLALFGMWLKAIEKEMEAEEEILEATADDFGDSDGWG